MNIILEDAGKIGKIKVFKDILTTCFHSGAVLREDWNGSCSIVFSGGQLSPSGSRGRSPSRTAS